MIVRAVGAETRLQHALRMLDESQALLAQHDAELGKLLQAGHCVREALAIHDELREKVAQGRRDVIRAQDRIRFGLDDACTAIAVVSEAAIAVGGAQAPAGEPARPATANRKEHADAAIKPRRARQAA